MKTILVDNHLNAKDMMKNASNAICEMDISGRLICRFGSREPMGAKIVG